MRPSVFFVGILTTVLLSTVFGGALPVTYAQGIEEERREAERRLSKMRDECMDQMIEELQEERNIYKGVQYDQSQRSVLSTSAQTSDLVPYLVLNYTALACRLRYFCGSIGVSHGHIGTNPVLSYRPVGCSRLFAARGRWWDPARRDRVFKTKPIEECAYYKFDEKSVSYSATAHYATVEGDCDNLASLILEEERQMLRLLVAQDSANRTARRGIRFFQSALASIRRGFLDPLREAVSLFGSILHPIPCLLAQCN